MLQPTSDELIAQLNIASRKLSSLLDDELWSLHLTSSNYYFLLKIDPLHGVTQDQLYKSIYLSSSNVTRRLDQLIKLKLVRKERATDDKRSWHIWLTPEGQTLVNQIGVHLRNVNQRVFNGLDAAQIDQLAAALDQVNQNLDDVE